MNASLGWLFHLFWCQSVMCTFIHHYGKQSKLVLIEKCSLLLVNSRAEKTSNGYLYKEATLLLGHTGLLSFYVHNQNDYQKKNKKMKEKAFWLGLDTPGAALVWAMSPQVVTLCCTACVDSFPPPTPIAVSCKQAAPPCNVHMGESHTSTPWPQALLMHWVVGSLRAAGCTVPCCGARTGSECKRQREEAQSRSCCCSRSYRETAAEQEPGCCSLTLWLLGPQLDNLALGR